jgi:hypothetical protein
MKIVRRNLACWIAKLPKHLVMGHRLARHGERSPFARMVAEGLVAFYCRWKTNVIGLRSGLRTLTSMSPSGARL